MKKLVSVLSLAALGLTACGGADKHPDATATPNPTVDKETATAIRGKSSLASSYPDAKYPTPNKVIHLTFDDGPSKYTTQVLKILKEENVQATFFIIGRQVSSFPDAMKEEKALGMSMQVHTWDHIHTYPTLSTQGIGKQVNPTALAIKKYSGVRPVCVRPPAGATNGTVRRYLNGQGYGQILWSVDTEDWRRPGVKSIINTALSEASNEGIILMHDGGGNRTQDLAALPTLIESLKKRGYRFEPLCTGTAVKNLPF